MAPNRNDQAARFRAAARRAAPDAAPRDRAVGAMIGTFVGDALGMPWEGVAGEGVPDRPQMRDARLGRGTYTDDTEMMIAVAESLLTCDVVDVEHLARTFVATHDPRRGYGAGTARVLELLERGTEVDVAARQIFGGQGSLGNGAAMRVAPIAVRFYEDEILVDRHARRSARVTHTHDVGIDAAAAQAAAIAAALDDEDPLAAAVRAARNPRVSAQIEAAAMRTSRALTSYSLRPGGTLGVPPTGDASVAAAVVAAARAADFEEAVSVAVGAGGDTDTVGAMAGAIAGARFGVGAIPDAWLDALEDGPRGRRYVERLAARLADRSQTGVMPSTLRSAG